MRFEKIFSGIHEVIGQTPMVSLTRLIKIYGVTGNIYAKLENLNPGNSKKDRIALQIIEAAEKSGFLRKEQPVVELTSGNTGTGLAIVCAVKGYKFIAVMSKGNSSERARMMRALGAEVVLVDQAKGSVTGQVSGEDLALVEEETNRIVRRTGGFRVDQFNSMENVHAHELTGKEMWQQCDGRIDAYLDFAGTAGSFTGCAKALKKNNSKIRCYVVEPDSAQFLAGKPITNSSHKIQGGGYISELKLLDKSLVTDYLAVSDDEAIKTARDLAKYEGIFAGFSSGANVAAALKLLSGIERGNTIGLIINDTGLKYISTDLYV